MNSRIKVLEEENSLLLMKVESNLDSHEKEIKTLRSQRDEDMKSLNMNLKVAQAKNDDLILMNSDIEERCQILLKENEITVSSNKKLEGENTRLNLLKTELTSENSRLRSIHSKYGNYNSELTSKNKDLLCENTDLQESSNKLKSKNDQLRRDNNELERINKELEQKNSLLSQENSYLSDQNKQTGDSDVLISSLAHKRSDITHCNREPKASTLSDYGAKQSKTETSSDTPQTVFLIPTLEPTDKEKMVLVEKDKHEKSQKRASEFKNVIEKGAKTKDSQKKR